MEDCLSGGAACSDAMTKAFNDAGVQPVPAVFSSTTATTAVEELQNWDKRKRRMEALGIELPDASVALKKISSGIATVVEKDKELSFRIQMWRSIHRLDTAANWSKVGEWLKTLEGELSHIQLTEEANKDEKLKAMNANVSFPEQFHCDPFGRLLAFHSMRTLLLFLSLFLLIYVLYLQLSPPGTLAYIPLS
jgi:hypothetical protein